MTDINSDTIPFDDEIESVRQQYCASSGRPLSKVPHDVVANLLTIHGRTTTIKILQTQQIKYSYDWIWLNHDGLDALAFHRPKEYFVYTASKLLQNLTLHSELMRMHEAAQAWQNLQDVDDSIIIPINETLRRLLANYKSKQLDKLMVDFPAKRVCDITANMQTLGRFQLDITTVLQTMIERDRKQEQLERGMSMFRGQRMITALSQLELSVRRELNDFDLIDGKSADVIHARTGTEYRHIGKAPMYSKKTIVKKQTGFKLNLKIGGNK